MSIDKFKPRWLFGFFYFSSVRHPCEFRAPENGYYSNV